MQKKYLILSGIVILAIVGVGGFFGWQYFTKQQVPIACTMEAKLCPDGSSVGRSGPKCEFAQCPESNVIIYKNDEYGFELTLPKSWLGYSAVKEAWQGRVIDTGEQKYSGPTIAIRNPNWTIRKPWQDIPVMVFTKDEWNLVSGPQPAVAVSAAPIGPQKIGENTNYVFALPPRWIGFADALGQDEAQEIVKTFKAF